MVRLLPLLFLVACGGGPDASTLVPELRVMAIVPEIPEMSPGQTTPAMVRVLDPLGGGAEVWVWGCSPFEGDCLGAPPAPTPTDLGDGHIAATLTADAGLAAVANETPQTLVLAWALACVPGVCDSFFDDATAMSDPITRMKAYPIAGTSLASWGILVSTRAGQHLNPTLTGTDALSFTVDADNGEAYAFTTAGGFTDGRVRPEERAFDLEFVPPDDPGPAELFVVFQDDFGGVATWDGSIP